MRVDRAVLQEPKTAIKSNIEVPIKKRQTWQEAAKSMPRLLPVLQRSIDGAEATKLQMLDAAMDARKGGARGGWQAPPGLVCGCVEIARANAGGGF